MHLPTYDVEGLTEKHRSDWGTVRLDALSVIHVAAGPVLPLKSRFLAGMSPEGDRATKKRGPLLRALKKPATSGKMECPANRKFFY